MDQRIPIAYRVMSTVLHPVCAKEAACKCCGARASLYGVVDFHKNCAVPGRQALPCSGVPIYYHRCPQCQFIFTTAFDHYKIEDFKRDVYNDDYVLIDPDYVHARPRANAAFLASTFAAKRPERILDYGGGHGLLEQLLRAAGFSSVDTYDPFVPAHSARPPHRYDCIVSFEVVEHATDPRRVFIDMNDLLVDPGVILFSTLLQPANIDQQGLGWWYVLPRNGHVSLFSRASLQKLVQPFGLRLVSFNDNFHALFRAVPEFAQHLIPGT
jgi:2-polyprenyl-6-hydroxyphenyl methylase/3-demethylubiquinone-9 3-methyltransferase